MPNDSVYSNGSDALRLVNKQAAEMAQAEAQCEKGYAHLGWLLLEVCDMQYWRLRHETFKKYIEGVAFISKKTPEQLYRYFLTVRDLSDSFKIDELESMGITKAMRLRSVKDYAIILPPEVVKAALDPMVTAKELKKIISTTLRMPEEDKGDWMDLDGFMVSPEERVLIEQAIDVAKHLEPLTKVTISASAQMKDVVLKWCMDFLGTYGGGGTI